MGNTIKFLRIAISAFMLIICTHPAFSAAVIICSAIQNQTTCENNLSCEWKNGACTTKFVSTDELCMCDPTCSSGSYCFNNELNNSCSCQQCLNGSYCPGGQKEYKCPENYPNSSRGSDNIYQCYLLTLQPGEMLQNKKAVACAAGGFCPYTITISYTTDNSNLANTWGLASCADGTEDYTFTNINGRSLGSAAGSKLPTDCYANCGNSTIDNGHIKPDEAKEYASTTDGKAYRYSPCTYTKTANVVCNTGYKKNALTCDPIQYSIQYNKNHYATTCLYKTANGMSTLGNCPENYKSGTINYDTNFSLVQRYETITGYTFDKWYTNSDCTGTSYSATATVNKLTTTDGGTVNLYACWTPNEYKVEFKANQGTGTMPIQTLTYDNDSQKLYKNTFTRTGYIFKNWNTKSDGTGTSYSDEEYEPNITSTGTVTLYAQWEPDQIQFNLKPTSIKTGDGREMALTYQKDPKPLSIKVTYGQNVFYGKSPNTEWAELKKVINAYKIDSIPIVSGKVFKGYIKKVNTTVTELIDKKGLFLDGFSSTTFSSQADVNNNFYPNFALCKCTGENFTECNVVGTDDTNKCQYQTKCNTGYSIGGGYNTDGVDSYYAWNADSAATETNTINCSARTFDFTFNANEGSVTNVSRTGVAYDSVPDDLTAAETPQRTGYTFYGYSTAKLYRYTMYFDADGKFIYNSENGNKWQETFNATMYAQWDANTYTVTLNNDGADLNDGTTSVTATYDSVLPAITDIPQKTGRDFGGYFSGTNCSGTKYINADGSATNTTWTTDSGATLYACWIPDAFTIDLNENGADTYFLPDNQKKLTLIYGVNYYPHGTKYDETGTTSPVTQLAQIPIKTEYVFKGFFYGDRQVYSENGVLNNGMTQLVLSNSEFIASYEACTCTAGNHSTCSVDLTTEDNECQYAITCDSGYHVNGKDNGVLSTSVTGEAGESAYTSDDCIARKFTVTLYDDYGSGGLESITVTYNVKPAKIGTLPTRTGYEFLGYFDANNGEGGTQYFNANGEFVKGDTWNTVAGEELYAHWRANTYTVTLDNDGADSATPGTASVTATYDSDMPDITTPQKTGNTFQGYYTKKDGEGKPYYKADGTSANTWDIAVDNTTLYAKWDANKYKVEFEPNCTSTTPEGYMEPQDRTYGDGRTGSTLTANNFKCGEKVFMEWNTQADGKGDFFDDKSTKDITTGTGTVTLYAQWIQCQAGCYCSGPLTKDKIKANNEVCTENCPTNFTSDAGASAITDCYLDYTTTIFTDSYGAQIKVPSDVKYYYMNKTTNQSSE